MGTIFEHFGSQMGSILEHLGVKIWRFWGLGVAGGASGSHVGPPGRPEGPKVPKLDEKAHPQDPHLGTMFDTFVDWWLFFWRHGPQSVFERRLGSIF